MNMQDEVYKFCKKLGIDVPPYREGVINPNEKSVESLKDKMYRNVIKLDNDDYTLINVNDMIRCTITVDSYGDVPQLLHDLKESFPYLTGYISEFDNGYRGIHLNFNIDGFNAEIQIHTPEVAFTNQATENIYARWRSFDENFEIQKLLDSNLTEEEKQIKSDEILKKAEQHKLEYEECRKLYEKQNSLTDFDNYNHQIRGILDAFSFEMKNVNKQGLPENIERILKIKPYHDKIINEDMLDKQARLLNHQSKIRQEILINKVNECRNNLNYKHSYQMREIEKFFMNASIEWDRIFYSEIKKVTGKAKNFNYLINRKKRSCIQKIYQYSIDNKIVSKDINFIMKTFFNDKKVASEINKKTNPTSIKEISDIDIINLAKFVVKDNYKKENIKNITKR